MAEHEPLVDDGPRCWIDGLCYSLEGKSSHLTGAQIRALPLPSVRDSDDLFLEVPGDEDVIVEYDEAVRVEGRRFFTVPRFINAG